MTFILALGGQPLIYVRNANLSTVGRAAAPSIEYDTVDVTAFSDSARRNLLSIPTITVRYDGLFDGTGNSSHNALKDILDNKRAVTVWMTGAGTGTEGIGLTSAYGVPYRPGGAVGEVVTVGADIKQDGTWDRVVSLGSATTVQFAASATFAGPDVDGAATATNGGAFFVHVFTMATGTLSFQLQDSTGGAGTGYANAAGGATGTFAGGTSFGTSFVFTGSLRQYRRVFVTTIAGGGTGTAIFQASVSTR